MGPHHPAATSHPLAPPSGCLGTPATTHPLAHPYRCLGIFDNEHNGAVIGGANMRNNEVVFDRESRKIAFVPSDCGAMHRGAQASFLQGGYGLSGCGGAGATFDTPGVTRSPPPPKPEASPPPPRPVRSTACRSTWSPPLGSRQFGWPARV